MSGFSNFLLIVERYFRRRSLKQHTIFGDPERVQLADNVVLNNTLFNVISGTITIGEYAFFGHNVCLLTGNHDWRKTRQERILAVPQSGHDIVIGPGVWVSSNATIIGPCVIGEDAVVAAGAVVTTDVAARTIVGGVPARVIGTVERDH